MSGRNLLQVAGRFVAGHDVQAISPLGDGLINDTFLVAAGNAGFVLQRINPNVFPAPERVMHNLGRLGRHIRQLPAADVRLQIPDIVPTLDGQAFYRDGDGLVWRALQLIEPAESRSRLQNQEEAAQIGFALGHFHRLCRNLAADELHDTLPGFHVTPLYYQDYLNRLAQPLEVAPDSEFDACRKFIEKHSEQIGVLEQARQAGELSERVIHGDPKLNNFLFLPGSDRVVSLIDLDTVKPGLLHYDIGDCLRSCCHDRAAARFDMALCRIILRHYLQEAGELWSAVDYDYLYQAIWLIPFELGLRFFSDYLAGDSYFKVREPKQNLSRAMAQFALCDSIASQQVELQTCIRSLKA